MELSPNLHWLDGGASNLYLIVEEEGLTLVDAGVPKRQQLVLDTIEQINRSPSELTRIVVTHADVDHVGSLAAIQSATGAKIYASAATAEFLVQGKSPKHLPWHMQFVVDKFLRYKPVSADLIETVQEGDILPVLGGLTVMAAPGHTPDHHAFFCPSAGVLFAGDALNTRDGRINPSPPRVTADQEAAAQSAIRLLELAPATIACGHGRPSSSHSADDLMAVFNQLRKPA
ncbi:MAG: MBL fold metallo-hydrolase [Chloroflexi bacterium]|nr:MBL fold metallo-hydrolase [Chloroflexota bacterium]